jgi:CubicO group peptidase (beta-lactamase class C family)
MISAMVLQLIRNGKLSFETKLAEYLKEDEINGLLVFRGKDYSKQITTEHLLSHTSGLPGYLIDKQADGRMAMKELEAGIDQPWDIDKVIGTIKTMKPHFAPGTSGKAKYIDTNHHLLSLVINRVTGKTFQENLDPILEDLQIKDTFVFGSGIREFSTIYFRKYKRDITQFMSSTGIDIIATAEDQMKFLKAFFNGYFYPKEKLKQLEKWNGIFFPFEYGIGIQKVSIPRILSPFKAIPKIIGHSGSTGCLAFYIPEKDLYVTGTINQQAAPRLAFQTLFKIINAV